MHVTYHGGAGAVSGADGGPLWGAIVAAGAPQVGDIELLELRLPLHFHRYELAQDSACPGRWRGGLGAVLELEIVDHDAVVTHFGDGTLYPPPSRLGGGSPADLRTRVHTKAIIRSGGIREPLPLHAVVTAHAGERLLVMTPGGGGVGDPHERPSELVSLDAQNGLISVASARDEYAVILDPVSFDVDADATAALRQKPDAGGEEG
jgi:N-methylhydantoinase B